MLKVFNSLTRKVEDFKPINRELIGIYTCGPTVYNFQHIGNFRTMIFSDILIRVLMANGFNVKSVRNITDIDDKIIKGAKEASLPIDQFSAEFTRVFFEDLSKLNILPVNENPKATEFVGSMVKYIEELIKKGLAYTEKDGSVYFDISKFPNYGLLSGLDKRQLKSGTRILSDEYTKDNVQDFALWKAVEPQEVGYDSPWGRGRPGWHIECSVMSQTLLGDTFDIHAGGIDLLFPHHENEIAQSEGKTGKKFVNYFIHGDFILVDGEKMSKSKKNFYILSDLIEKGFDPIAYRYLTLTAHYRDKLNFTWESLTAAAQALSNLRQQIRLWEQPKGDVTHFYQRFMESANNDLNMPQAVAVMWEMVRSDNTTSSKSADLLAMDKILGLGLDQYLGKPLEVPLAVQKLIDARENARKIKDFEKSDMLRKEIKDLGYEIEDTPNGFAVKPLK